MYLKLKVLMKEKKLTIEKIAKVLNIHRNTLRNKLDGKQAFTIKEIQLVRDSFFKDKTIDELISDF